MKHKIILLALLSACLLFASCAKSVDKVEIHNESATKEDISEPQIYEEPSHAGEIADEEDVRSGYYKDLLLNGHNLGTNKEVFELFSFLLEDGKDLTVAEVSNVQSISDDDDNVASTYYWYSQRGLNDITLEILETKDLGSRSTGGFYDENEDGESYYLKVNVTSAGESKIPLGQQEWVFQTTLPAYNFGALTPDQLITFEEYKLRSECTEYVEYTDLIKSFINFGINESFNSFSEIPDEQLIHYILYTVPLGEDGTLTQEEVDQHAKELFGIDHLAPTEGLLYDSKTETFAPYGYGPPYPYDYFKRVTKDDDGIHFDYVGPTTALRYTIRDGKLIKATNISEEDTKSYGTIVGMA